MELRLPKMRQHYTIDKFVFGDWTLRKGKLKLSLINLIKRHDHGHDF